MGYRSESHFSPSKQVETKRSLYSCTARRALSNGTMLEILEWENIFEKIRTRHLSMGKNSHPSFIDGNFSPPSFIGTSKRRIKNSNKVVYLREVVKSWKAKNLGTVGYRSESHFSPSKQVVTKRSLYSCTARRALSNGTMLIILGCENFSEKIRTRHLSMEILVICHL